MIRLTECKFFVKILKTDDTFHFVTSDQRYKRGRFWRFSKKDRVVVFGSSGSIVGIYKYRLQCLYDVFTETAGLSWTDQRTISFFVCVTIFNGVRLLIIHNDVDHLRIKD